MTRQVDVAFAHTGVSPSIENIIEQAIKPALVDTQTAP